MHTRRARKADRDSLRFGVASAERLSSKRKSSSELPSAQGQWGRVVDTEAAAHPETASSPDGVPDTFYDLGVAVHRQPRLAPATFEDGLYLRQLGHLDLYVSDIESIVVWLRNNGVTDLVLEAGPANEADAWVRFDEADDLRDLDDREREQLTIHGSVHGEQDAVSFIFGPTYCQGACGPDDFEARGVVDAIASLCEQFARAPRKGIRDRGLLLGMLSAAMLIGLVGIVVTIGWPWASLSPAPTAAAAWAACLLAATVGACLVAATRVAKLQDRAMNGRANIFPERRGERRARSRQDRINLLLAGVGIFTSIVMTWLGARV